MWLELQFLYSFSGELISMTISLEMDKSDVLAQPTNMWWMKEKDLLNDGIKLEYLQVLHRDSCSYTIITTSANDLWLQHISSKVVPATARGDFDCCNRFGGRRGWRRSPLHPWCPCWQQPAWASHIYIYNFFIYTFLLRDTVHHPVS